MDDGAVIRTIVMAGGSIVVATRRPDPLLLQRGLEFQASFRVHINESIWVDWMQLEGIGPSRSANHCRAKHPLPL